MEKVGPEKNARGGFSLIELLVVLTIIALLAGLIISAISAARERARTTVCASNLRQWSIACINYCQQHDDYLPRRGMGVQPTSLLSRPEDWFNALPTVMAMDGLWDTLQSDAPLTILGKFPWRCPTADDPVRTPTFYYAMNMRLSTWNSPQPVKLTSITNPATQLFLSESGPTYGSILPSTLDYSPIARHRGRINIAFLDGHVDNFDGAYVGCGVGDPLRSDICWVIPGDPWPGPQSN